MHFDIYDQAKPVTLPRVAGNKQKRWRAPCRLLIPPRAGKSRVAGPLACCSAFLHLPAAGLGEGPASPPSRLPTTLLRACSGWGLAAHGDAAGCAGRVMRAGWAARRGSQSRAPRRCNRTPELSPPTPGHFPFTPRCLIELRGEGLRVPQHRIAEDSFTKKLRGRGRKNFTTGTL